MMIDRADRSRGGSTASFLLGALVASLVLIGAWAVLGSGPANAGEGTMPASADSTATRSPEESMPVDPPHQVRVPSKPLEAPGDEPPPSKVSAEIPGWIRQVGYDVGLKPELIMAAVSGKPELVDKLKRVQQELNEPIVEAIVARDKLVGQISLARQAEGRYEVFRHGQRLPDPDPRYGEYIATGYEPEPEGGPDRVRIIRILPGENAEFDRARTRVIDLEAARRTAILFLLRLQPR